MTTINTSDPSVEKMLFLVPQHLSNQTPLRLQAKLPPFRIKSDRINVTKNTWGNLHEKLRIHGGI